MLERVDQTADYPFDLGPYSRPITTTAPQAQVWFDRGLNWIWGFNFEEAAACFQRATEFDPECAMAHWGIAYCVGPNYNKPWELFDPQDLLNSLTAARSALSLAVEKLTGGTAAEQALIRALTFRYRDDGSADDLYAWSRHYADAMRAVHAQFGEDTDIAVFFVDSLMNLYPWRMWDLKTGQPTEGADTRECQSILEREITARRASGQLHAGLWHLYVHLMEMSPTPEKALRVGDELRRLIPDSGHIAHMPTHIDIQCGNYQDVVDWNQSAISKDIKYFEYAGPMNIYSLYRAHNYHFKQYGAMFLGQYAPALEAVRTMRETIPDALIRVESPPMADWFECFMTIGTHAYVRFGKWQELIDDPLPEDRKLYCTVTAMNWYGKGIAFANLKRIDEARDAQRKFEEAVAAVPETRHLHVVPAHSILAVARELLAGELEYHSGNHALGFEHLNRAVQLEDNLPYDEPWAWMMPSRHALGALLMEQGRYAEAAAAYEADLGLSDAVIRANRHPNNVWALLGLHRCYEALGETAKAALIKPQLDVALARADPDIYASCFCATKKTCCGAGIEAAA